MENRFNLTRQGEEAFQTAASLTNSQQTVISTDILVAALSATNDSSAGQSMLYNNLYRTDIEKELRNAEYVDAHEKKDVSINYVSFSNFDNFENKIRSSPVPLIVEPGDNVVVITDRQYRVTDYVLHGLNYAQSLLEQRAAGKIETQDILLGITDLQDMNAFWLLLKLALLHKRGYTATAYTNIVQRMFNYRYYQDGEGKQEQAKEERKQNYLFNKVNQPGYSILEDFAKNLTQLAKEHKLSPVVGRDKEIEHLALVLNRRQKSNALLVGAAGVGKTAIVEGLASRIAEGKLPSLANKTIYALDPDKLVLLANNGTLRDIFPYLISELTKHPGRVLFIDEIQQLRFVSGPAVINELKPAMARGDIQLIGATTPLEAQIFFDKDQALIRRFETVNVKPMTRAQAMTATKTAILPFENFYHLNYSQETLQMANDLAAVYLPTALPDSAFTILDNAGALVNNRCGEQELPTDRYQTKRDKLQRELNQARKKSLNDQKIRELEEQIRRLDGSYQQVKNSVSLQQYSRSVTIDDIIQATEQIIGHPLSKQMVRTAQREREIGDASILQLDQRLKKVIVGQDEAIDQLVEALMIAKAGLRSPGAPIGAFFFAGLTGTGKTETAKQLAINEFGSERNLLRFNMPDYANPLGTFQFTNALYQQVASHPNSVILLDEIEKVGTPIYNLLLSILDDGDFLNGLNIDFSHTIIIMTSNIGASQLLNNNQVGFGVTENEKLGEVSRDIVLKAMRKHFSPEFLNRLSATVVFNRLTHDDFVEITKLLLRKAQQRLAEKNITLSYDSDLCDLIVERFADPLNGARPLQRGIDHLINSQLAPLIIRKQLTANQTVKLTVDKTELKVTVE